MSIKSFIRFIDDQGATLYGEPTIASLSKSLEGTTVGVLNGDPFKGLSKTGKKAKVKQVRQLQAVGCLTTLRLAVAVPSRVNPYCSGHWFELPEACERSEGMIGLLQYLPQAG
jgi:hypothetical protein